MKTTAALQRPLLVLGLLAALTFGACSAGAAVSPPPTSSPPPSGQPTPGDPGGGDGTSGNPGTGVGVPGNGGGDPGIGQPTLVVARPGQQGLHPVGALLLEPSVDGRRVLVKVSWYSGVEPCYVLDSVKIDQGGNEFVLTIFEGSSDLNAVCIELAMLKATIVDLGEVEPGEYTIRASDGDAAPVTVTVS